MLRLIVRVRDEVDVIEIGGTMEDNEKVTARATSTPVVQDCQITADCAKCGERGGRLVLTREGWEHTRIFEPCWPPKAVH